MVVFHNIIQRLFRQIATVQTHDRWGTTQFLLDIGLSYYYSGLSGYTEGALTSEINQSVSVWELHGGLIVSKALKITGDSWVTPYAGINMLSESARWNAMDYGVTYNGNGSSFHVIIGMEVAIKSFSIKAESSLLDGFGVAAGFNYEFGY